MPSKETHRGTKSKNTYVFIKMLLFPNDIKCVINLNPMLTWALKFKT